MVVFWLIIGNMGWLYLTGFNGLVFTIIFTLIILAATSTKRR